MEKAWLDLQVQFTEEGSLVGTQVKGRLWTHITLVALGLVVSGALGAAIAGPLTRWPKTAACASRCFTAWVAGALFAIGVLAFIVSFSVVSGAGLLRGGWSARADVLSMQQSDDLRWRIFLSLEIQNPTNAELHLSSANGNMLLMNCGASGGSPIGKLKLAPVVVPPQASAATQLNITLLGDNQSPIFLGLGQWCLFVSPQDTLTLIDLVINATDNMLHMGPAGSYGFHLQTTCHLPFAFAAFRCDYLDPTSTVKRTLYNCPALGPNPPPPPPTEELLVKAAARGLHQYHRDAGPACSADEAHIKGALVWWATLQVAFIVLMIGLACAAGGGTLMLLKAPSAPSRSAEAEVSEAQRERAVSEAITYVQQLLAEDRRAHAGGSSASSIELMSRSSQPDSVASTFRGPVPGSFGPPPTPDSMQHGGWAYPARQTQHGMPMSYYAAAQSPGPGPCGQPAAYAMDRRSLYVNPVHPATSFTGQGGGGSYVGPGAGSFGQGAGPPDQGGGYGSPSVFSRGTVYGGQAGVYGSQGAVYGGLGAAYGGAGTYGA